MHIFKLILGFLLVTFLSSCATIMHGPQQDVYLSSKPAGVVVKVSDMTITTPGSIKLDRKQPMYILEFEKEGYGPVKVKLVQTTDGWLWGNILIGGIIGMVVDFSTGSAYVLTPEKTELVMKKIGQENLNSKDADVLIFIDRDNLKQKNKDSTNKTTQDKNSGVSLSY